MLALEQKSILKNTYEKSETCFCFFWLFDSKKSLKKISFDKNAKTYYYNDSGIFHNNDKHIIILK
jgi:hypothetical protein